MLAPLRNSAFIAFRHRNFRLYTWGQIINLGGTRVHEVAAGWLMWELTGSATWVGASAMVEIIPRLTLWPLAGAIADRGDLRKLAIIFQLTGCLIASTLFALTATGHIGVYGLLAFAILFGMNSAFWQPIRLAITPHMVTRDALASAVALSSMVANIARVVGPIVAGPVLIWGSPTLAFGLNTVSYFAVVAAFWLMQIPRLESRFGVKPKLSLKELSFGATTIFRSPGIRFLLIFIAIFAICIRPAVELLPVFAESVFQSGPAGLASLIAVFGTGALFSSIAAAMPQRQRGFMTLLAVAGTVGSLTTGAFALSPNLTVGLLFMFFVGFSVTLANIVAQTILQLSLTDDIRGRVLSVYGVLFTSAPGLGRLPWAG
jgi:MFS family permease